MAQSQVDGKPHQAFIESHQSARATNVVIATIAIPIFNLWLEQNTSDTDAYKGANIWCSWTWHWFAIFLYQLIVIQYANIFQILLNIVTFLWLVSAFI